MSDSRLSLCRGARPVTLDELAAVPTPEATRTWAPVPHVNVLAIAQRELRGAGYAIRRLQLGLSRGDQRLFATADLEYNLVEGVGLSIGIRSSIDRSLALGFCAGSRVHVCDNLAFSAELVVRRKHTTNGRFVFENEVAEAVTELTRYRSAESLRINVMRERPLNRLEALGLIAEGYRGGVISARQIDDVVDRWETVSEIAPQPPTAWRLYNAFTGALAAQSQSNPERFQRSTMLLGKLLAAVPSTN
jgi:hypothetical protein